jgi:hypothetical protein
MNWINLNDKKSSHKQRVLVFGMHEIAGNDIYICRYFNQQGRDTFNCQGSIVKNVEFFMELPKKPL